MNYDFDFSELSTLEKRKKDIECKLKEQQKKEHLNFVKEHHKLLLFFDIVIIASVLMNIGAVFMTNMLVMQEQPEMVLQEMNPVQAEVNNYQSDYETNKETRTFFSVFLMNALMWVVVISLYIYNRTIIRNNMQLFCLIIFVVWVGYLITYDFMNNLGFIIGRWLNRK